MKTKALSALFAGALIFGLAGVAQADPIFLDLGAGGGVDGHVNGDLDADQKTGDFDQFSVFADTTTTQLDTDGSGGLSDGDEFSDQGHLVVNGLIPTLFGNNEGINNTYQITAEWSGLKGTSTALSDNGDGTSTGVIRYNELNNTVFSFYVDSFAGGVSDADFNGIGEGDDVDSTFNDGVLVLQVRINGGIGANLFDNDTGAFLGGESVLTGEVIFALEDFLFFADGDLDFNDLIGAAVKIGVFIDQNTDDAAVTNFGPCGDGDDATPCNPGDPLFQVLSTHDGSIDFVLVPEPASVLLFGLGFLALGGISVATRRQQA